MRQPLAPERRQHGDQAGDAGAVVAAERGRAGGTMRSPASTGLAPAHSGTVSRCAENIRRGSDGSPATSTMRLPVWVGTGMRRCGVVEADRLGGHAELAQGGDDLLADRALVAGGALDGEEAHQVGDRLVAVDVGIGPSSRTQGGAPPPAATARS